MESPGKRSLEIPSSQCTLNLKEAQVHLAGTGVWQCPISPEPSTMSSLVVHVGPLRGGHWHCLWASEAGTVLSPMEISVLSGTLLATFLYRTHSISYVRAEETGSEGRLGTWLLISC